MSLEICVYWKAASDFGSFRNRRDILWDHKDGHSRSTSKGLSRSVLDDIRLLRLLLLGRSGHGWNLSWDILGYFGVSEKVSLWKFHGELTNNVACNRKLWVEYKEILQKSKVLAAIWDCVEKIPQVKDCDSDVEKVRKSNSA